MPVEINAETITQGRGITATPTRIVVAAVSDTMAVASVTRSDILRADGATTVLRTCTAEIDDEDKTLGGDDDGEEEDESEDDADKEDNSDDCAAMEPGCSMCIKVFQYVSKMQTSEL